ncbi:MAG: hypothetical protein V2A66_02395 [Pseudomonadota bacterium]
MRPAGEGSNRIEGGARTPAVAPADDSAELTAEDVAAESVSKNKYLESAVAGRRPAPWYRRAFSGFLSMFVEANPPASGVFEDAGLVLRSGLSLVVVDSSSIKNYLRLFEAAGHRSGGLLGLIRDPDIIFARSNAHGNAGNKHADIDGMSPSDFFRARNEAAHAGKEDLRSLVLLYRNFLRQTADGLQSSTDLSNTMGSWNERARRSLQTLLVVLESIRNESPKLVAELAHHAALADLAAIREGLVRKLGPDPSLWDEAISAHRKRSPGAEIGFEGAMTSGDPALFADHPLFDPAVRAAPQRLGGPGKLDNDFKRVATHDGSLLFARDETFPAGRPQARVTGDPASLAEIAERLIAANGGTNLDSAGDAYFPVNQAISQMRAFPSSLDTWPNELDLANATAIAFLFNEGTMMHELVFGHSHNFIRSVGNNVPSLQESLVPRMLEWVLDTYRKDASYERPFLVSSSPDAESILVSIRNAARQAGPEIYSTVVSALRTHDVFSSAMEGKDVHEVRAGVTVDRKGKLAAIVVQLFDEPDGFLDTSPVTVLEGRIDSDGGLRWTTELHDSAPRHIDAFPLAPEFPVGLTPKMIRNRGNPAGGRGGPAGSGNGGPVPSGGPSGSTPPTGGLAARASTDGEIRVAGVSGVNVPRHKGVPVVHHRSAAASAREAAQHAISGGEAVYDQGLPAAFLPPVAVEALPIIVF